MRRTPRKIPRAAPSHSCQLSGLSLFAASNIRVPNYADKSWALPQAHCGLPPNPGLLHLIRFEVTSAPCIDLTVSLRPRLLAAWFSFLSRAFAACARTFPCVRRPMEQLRQGQQPRGGLFASRAFLRPLFSRVFKFSFGASASACRFRSCGKIEAHSPPSLVPDSSVRFASARRAYPRSRFQDGIVIGAIFVRAGNYRLWFTAIRSFSSRARVHFFSLFGADWISVRHWPRG